MRRSLRSWSAAFVLISLVPLTITGSSSGAASARATCHVPKMTGLTVAAARTKAKVAGCRLRLVGSPLNVPAIQTIRAQSVRPGRSASVVSITVNRLCQSAGLPGPPSGEPIVKAGPTELITGLFLEGGPLMLRSAPVCKKIAGKSSGGTITITNSVGTILANNMQLSAGQLLSVNVQPGTYTITGIFGNGLKGGTITVNVSSGEVVRQDVVLDVP